MALVSRHQDGKVREEGHPEVIQTSSVEGEIACCYIFRNADLPTLTVSPYYFTVKLIIYGFTVK
jgi:hypothetical protein